MPFKSEAQRSMFQAKLKRGEITQKQFDEWESATPKNIPDRIGEKRPNSVEDLEKTFQQKYGKK